MNEQEMSPAIAALRRHIREHYEGSVTRFARENKLDGGELGKILRGVDGRGTRVTVQFAEKIRVATGGEVGLELWLPEKGEET